MSTKSQPIATAKPSSEKKLITIEEFTFDRLSDVNAVKNEFTGGTNKFCLGCIPLACCPMEDSEYRSFFETNPSALKLGAVALNEKGDVIGAVEMQEHGVPRPFFDALLHSLKPKESYIAWLAVRKGNRGRGAGSALLKWCEDTAKERGNTRLTLGVVAGNPAKRLYQRKGFKTIEQDFVDQQCGNCCAWCIFGCPHCAWGGENMEKTL
eukprot:g2419.t1